MPNADLTIERIGEEVRTMLGASGVEVELSDGDLVTVTKRALRVFNRYLPFRGRFELPITQAQRRYRLDNHSGLTGLVLKGVTSVDFIERRVEPAGVDPFDPYVTSLTGPNYGDETFGDVMQRKMFAQDAQRIVSGEPEWHAQWERVALTPGPGWENQYALYISVERSDTSAGVFFIAAYENSDEGRQMIPESEVDWITNWCIAESKIILTRIRGKFGGVTNPEGSNDEIDWQQLAQEATEEMQRLEEEIRQRKRPYLPVIE